MNHPDGDGLLAVVHRTLPENAALPAVERILWKAISRPVTVPG